MSEIAYPRRKLTDLSPQRKTLAVEPHMGDIPAYRDIAKMDLQAMTRYAKRHGGVIMQQDDGWLPPFVLVKYGTDGQPQSVC